MTKSELNSAVSRIERAPNVGLLLRAIEAAYPDNAISVTRVRGQWEVSDNGFAHYASDFADVRRRLASFIEDILSHTLEEEPAEQAAAQPAMVRQQAQLQQANASIDRAVAKVIPGLRKDSFPLNRLRHGHDEGAPEGVCNVRVTGRDAGLDELAASIAAIGLLQPLVVVKSGGLCFVADGNRRLAALLRLAKAGTIAEDHEVDVVERDAATAREAGLAANFHQVRMHEADQYRAFHALRQEGMSEADIAARFGVEPVRVRRFLALGQLADEVLDAWRGGEFSRDPVETVRAFTLASSIDEQRTVLEKLRSGQRLFAHYVRSELGVGDHDVLRNLAYVGKEAYVAAGGGIVEDLFGDNHRVEDQALLMRMVKEGIQAEATRLVRDGWSWAVHESQIPDNARWSWQTIRADPRAGTEAETARLDELQAIVDADGDEDGVAVAERAAEEIERSQRLGGYTAEQKALSGVILRIGRGGTMDMTMGVIRPATAAVAVAKATAAIEGTDQAAAVKAAKAEQAESVAISAALTLRLSQQRTLAMRDAVMASPQVALAALLASAIAKDAYAAPARITVHGYREDQGGLGRGPDAETFEQAFKRLLDLPLTDLMIVAAGVAGQALDLQQQNPGCVPSHANGARALEGRLDGDRLGEALRERWDAADYMKAAPKAVLLRAVEEVLGQAEAKRIAGLTKAEIATVALARVVPKGWLPPELRWPGYKLPSAKKVTSKAA